GIPKESRPALERFIGQWGINIRHSQLEMNWHVPVDDQEALELKKFLVLSFDRNDISTYGLTFGISNDVGKRSHFASVIIERNAPPAIVTDFEVRPTYNVLHFKNFDPNTQKYETYAQDVDKIELPGLLMELSKKYFDQLYREEAERKSIPKKVEPSLISVYQCQSCLTVYDSAYGDAKANVLPGTDFDALDDTYVCAVCEASKSKFERVSLQFS
ncbi:MAG: rubredoxin, partial [Pricia sp.]